ncbi:MAG: hypothetical protein HY821_18470 [Acidobacteria bacterium]|nr:hypothetical protein [Acidobacteriota bacterium]
MWASLAVALLAAQAVSLPSPSGARSASVRSGSGSPAVVITDHSGRVVATLQPRPAEGCSSVSGLEWAGEDAVSVTCHINPSLNAFVEMEIATGKVRRELLGYGFTRSPDGLRVAHVGWYPHFSPPFAKSNVLQLDSLVVYPLPAGGRPVVRNGMDPAPGAPTAKGGTWSGIHEFVPDFHWSSDSRRVAFIDCVYAWTVDAQDNSRGQEHGRRCSVAVVDLEGRATLSPLPELKPAGLLQLKLAWNGPRELTVSGPASLTLRAR